MLKCSGRSIVITGAVLGGLTFIVCTTLYTNELLYYASGIWLADMYAEWNSEPSIAIALSIGLAASVLSMVVYCFAFCKLKALCFGKGGA